jgi:hypothetical protein
MLTPQRLLVNLAAALAALCGSPALAGPYADDLSKCLVRSTTVADKHALVKWMFATAALHPDVRSIASVSPEQRVEINKNLAALFERLLTVACRKETREALQFEGPSTMESSFQVLGQVAGRELFSDPQVASGMANTFKYIDAKKLQELAPPAR